MTDIVSKMITGDFRRRISSGFGLGFFCALVCMIALGISLINQWNEDSRSTDDFYEMALELKAIALENGVRSQDGISQASHHDAD